jgi:hypothetical protein
MEMLDAGSPEWTEIVADVEPVRMVQTLQHIHTARLKLVKTSHLPFRELPWITNVAKRHNHHVARVVRVQVHSDNKKIVPKNFESMDYVVPTYDRAENAVHFWPVPCDVTDLIRNEQVATSQYA